MKTDNTLLFRLVIIALILMGFNPNLFGQEFDISKYRVRFDFSTSKDIDNNRQLQVLFQATNKKDRKDRLPITDASVEFFQEANDTLLAIGEAKTDRSGIAKISIPESMELLQDEEGYYNFTASFKKTKGLKKQKKSLQVKELILDLNLTERDSSQYVTLQASTLDSLGEKTAVEELDVAFLVGGMLSKLPIEDGTVEDGNYEFKMPDDIPGDIDGNFHLFAFIDNHDDFGTVTNAVVSNWGVFDDIREPEKNKLWTDAAPIWMYVVLTFLLAGAWANFIYTIVQLRKIKKLGSNI